MAKKKVVILDGNDTGCAAGSTVLSQVIQSASADVQYFRLRDHNLAHCTGCFKCWIETPGICAAHDDVCRDILHAMMQSDMTVLYTPITFGGCSSVLKVVIDRFLPLLMPYFMNKKGETRHVPRYTRFPKLVGIGVRQQGNPYEDSAFKALIGRIAENFHAPSFSVEVFDGNEERLTLIKKVYEVINRSDSVPDSDTLAGLFPGVDPDFSTTTLNIGNALLLVGSPKVQNNSNSALLGGYVLDTMRLAGWNTTMLKPDRSVLQEEGRAALCAAVDRADVVIVAFPLYIDTLPYLVVKAMEVIAEHKRKSSGKRPQRLFALANNGYPEFHHSIVALANCRCFADRCGMYWAGGLATGAGEMIGRKHKNGNGQHPEGPVRKVFEALEDAGETLARGNTVQYETQRRFTRTPIPFMPFVLWRRMFRTAGNKCWDTQAEQNGVTKEEMYAAPYGV